MYKANTSNKGSKAMGSILFLFLLPLVTGAQVWLKGTVQQSKAPVAWANVVLTNANNLLVAGTVTKEDGSFALQATAGTYQLTISYMGFENWTKSIALLQDSSLGIIQLHPNSGEMKEVVITARKKLLEYKPDRLVFNVENSATATGGDAINALNAAPGVMVQQNTISMLGKGASKVMINGRLLELAGEELIQFLKGIPAADIKSIELISNPPAQYDASGNGGLINIVLKQGLQNSWKYTTTVAYNQNVFDFYTLNQSFLYNKHRLKLSAGVNLKTGNSLVLQDLTSYHPKGPWDLHYRGIKNEENASGRVAFDYDFTNNTTVGFQYLLNAGNSGSRDQLLVNFLNPQNNPDTILKSAGTRSQPVTSHAVNVHIISKLDTAGKKLSFDVDYFTYHSGLRNIFGSGMYAVHNPDQYVQEHALNASGQAIDNISARLDMEHPLSFGTFTYGARINFTRSKSNIDYYNLINEAPVKDQSRSNIFDYRENSQAVYINGTAALHPQLRLQAGLRLEHTSTEGRSSTLTEATKNNYVQLFPSFYLSYQPDKRNTYSFNYGRRINRPGFGLLNPFRSYINSSSYSEGNPFLQPSYNDNFELTHLYKGAWRTNVFFNITTNGFGPVFSSDPEKRNMIITRQNFLREYYFGVGEMYSANIFPWWQSQQTIYLLGSTSRFNDKVNAKPVNGVQLYWATSNTFQVSQSTRLQVDYTYSSPFKRGLYAYGSISGLNLGVQQTFLHKDLQVSFVVNDLFNAAYLKNFTSTVNGIRQVYDENNSSRFFRLSLIYQLGNGKIKVKERNFGNEEERKRVD